ncbi:MAG: Ku protein [Peptococcaceae bacterium]|nr:Ku protein [Peptococcaceae bacterium]
MRTLWKGALSFGLVNIPVKLYTSTESADVKFNFLHTVCHSPIKYEKHCPVCDVVVPAEEIVRGYEYEKGKYVILDAADFEGIAIEQTRTVNIIDFVDLVQIDPIYYVKTYYMTPGDGGKKAYALLRQAMSDTGKIAIAKVVLRNKQHLAAVRVYQNCLALETMFFPAEIRSTALLPELDAATKINDKELDMAVELIARLSTDFDPAKYTDDYNQALQAVLEAKVQGADVALAPSLPETDKVIDLMAALRASIQQAQQEKGSEPSPNVRGARSTPNSRQRKRKTSGE